LLTGLHHDLVYRALVRALVAQLTPPPQAKAPDYVTLALSLIRPPAATLLITHGLSGSGKSTVTQALLEGMPAIRWRADIERQRLFPASPDRYSHKANAHTYAHLLHLAQLALDSGEHVIVDATFLRASDRLAFAQMAQQRSTALTILHCQAPVEVLRARIAHRQAQGTDASEANLQVLAVQLETLEPLTAQEQSITILADTSAPANTADNLRQWRHIQRGPHRLANS
jgi:predicted kinase